MKLSKLVLAAMTGVLATGTQAAGLGDSLKFRSFGSIAWMHSSEDGADFYNAIAVTPEGPGRTESGNFTSGSKAAGQLDWQISDKLSFTGQALVKQFEDSSWTPRIEWAFLNYKAANNLDVRVGRIRPPVYMLSDYLDVNFANPWVRPVTELYYSVPVTNMNGIDVLWRPNFAGMSWLVQPYFGKKNFRLSSPGQTIDMDNMGLNVTASSGDFTYRAGYFDIDMDVSDLSGIQGALGGLNQICALGDPAACEQAEIVHQKDSRYKFLSLGVSWDNGDYFVQSEVGKAMSNNNWLADSIGYYVSGGMRLGVWTPYATYGNFNNQMPAMFNDGLVPTTNAIVTALYQDTVQDQNTVSVGVRYDVLPNVALKAQWDHTNTKCNSGVPGTCRGMFGNTTAAFRSNDQAVDLFSFAVDYIF